ncbi:MAG TPA: zf-HC2 domain-containing protein [Victivallales bacterium]|nr:zf-HC2 domain-containing protein [Victivallales bacterium]
MNVKGGKCPLLEDLSAYCDGELSRSSPAYIHIESCEECRLKVSRLSKISKAISLSLSNPPGVNCVSRKTVEALRSENRISATKLTPYWEIFLRVAAVIAIFAGSAVYIFDLTERKGENKLLALEKSEKIKNKDLILQPINKEKEEPTHQIADKNENMPHSPLNSFEISDMRNTGSAETNTTSKRIIFGAVPGESAANINDIVRHVWIWNKEGLAPSISDILKNSGIESFQKDGNEHVLITEKMRLVKIVRALHSEGYELLSPDEPQPESKRFSGHPEQKVEYHFSLAGDGN